MKMECREEFCMQEGVNRIKLYVMGYADVDLDGNTMENADKNKIEISYDESNDDGWASGSAYIRTTDIKNIADGIRSVISGEQKRFRYACRAEHFNDDFLHIELVRNTDMTSYCVTTEFLHTLFGGYISITKDGLTVSKLREYIQPFLVWEKEYSVQ